MARGLLGFTALMLAAFVALIGLGLWQLQRLEWKEGLIAKIEARTKAPPIGLEDAAAWPRKVRIRAITACVSADASITPRSDICSPFGGERRLARHRPARDGGRRDGPRRSGLRARQSEGPRFALQKARSKAWSPSPGSCASPTAKVCSPPTTSRRPIAGSGAIRMPWRSRCFPARASGSAPFFLEAEKGEVAGGLARGRPDAARPSQQPPAIRHHLVSAGGRASRRLRGVCVEGQVGAAEARGKQLTLGKRPLLPGTRAR